MYLTRVFTKYFSYLEDACDAYSLSTKILSDFETSNGDYSFYEGLFPIKNNNDENLKIVAVMLAKNTEKWMGNIYLLFCLEQDLASIKKPIPDEKNGPLGTKHYNMKQITVGELNKLFELFVANKTRNCRISFKEIKRFLKMLSEEDWVSLFESVSGELKKKNANAILHKYFRDENPPTILKSFAGL